MEYFAFQWHITDSCDQRCAHCYIFAEGHPQLVEMPLQKAREQAMGWEDSRHGGSAGTFDPLADE